MEPVTRRHLPSLWWACVATLVAYVPTAVLLFANERRYGSAVPTYRPLVELARTVAGTGMHAWAWAFMLVGCLLLIGLVGDAVTARVGMVLAAGLSSCWAIALWGYLAQRPPSFGAGSASAWTALALIQAKAASAARRP